MAAIAQRMARPRRERSLSLRSLTPKRILHALLVVALLAAALALGAVLLPRALGYGSLAVMSGSMGRAAPVGSLVIGSWNDRDEIADGDVILVRREGRAPVLHRVISLREAGPDVVVRLKGDANPVADPEAYTLPERVLRKEHAIPFLGYLVAALRVPLGWLLLVGIPATLIAVSILRDVWRRPGEAAEDETPPAPVPDPLAAALEERAARLADREAGLVGRAEALRATEKRLHELERQLAAREAAVAAREHAHAEVEAAWEERASARLEESEPEPGPAEETPSEHLLFVPGAGGYTLVGRAGAPPPVGAVVADENAEYVVTRLARSPLPGDQRHCAYLQHC